MTGRKVAICALLAALAAPAALGVPHKLPPTALRGNEHPLLQYPSVAVATTRQRAAAERLLAQIKAAAKHWPTPAAARAAGFDTRTARRRPGDLTVHFLHAENHRYDPSASHLDPQHPKALIYAN